MTRKDDGISGQLRQDIGEAAHQLCIAAAVEVGAADAHTEEGVAGEGGMLLGAVEDHAAGRVAGGLQYLQAVVAEADDLVGAEETAYGGVFAAERGADDALEVVGDVGDDEVVFLGGLHLQTIGLVDGVDAEVVVPVAVGGEETDGLETLTADVVGDGAALVVVVGATVDDDTFEGVVADHVGILLKEVEGECLYTNHVFYFLRPRITRISRIYGQIYNIFAFIPVFGEEGADVGGLHDVTEGLRLGLQVTALEAEDAVGQGVQLGLGNVLAHDLHEVGQGHHGAADDEVVLSALVLAAQVFRMAVRQADGLADLLRHADFLARAVDELELTVGEEDGQGDAGESTAGAEVEDARAGTETDGLGDGQRVEHVVLVELVDVLAGDDVDLRVPVVVEGVEGFELLLLAGSEVGEIFQNDICRHDGWN